MAHRWMTFLLSNLFFWLLAHSLAFFAHEFAHTFVALFLGWKSDPFALDWGHPSPLNVLLHTEIDENVDYSPIFASGHPRDAGWVALAGSALGNLVASLGLGLVLFTVARRRGMNTFARLGYWLVAMSVGNLISYVPLRVFATHADMYTTEVGFGWTPLEALLYVGIPYLVALLWFVLRFQPSALAWLHPASPARRIAMVLMTSATVFGFFCLGGLWSYGETSHRLSVAFMLILAPLSALLGIRFARTPFIGEAR